MRVEEAKFFVLVFTFREKGVKYKQGGVRNV